MGGLSWQYKVKWVGYPVSENPDEDWRQRKDFVDQTLVDIYILLFFNGCNLLRFHLYSTSSDHMSKKLYLLFEQLTFRCLAEEPMLFQSVEYSAHMLLMLFMSFREDYYVIHIHTPSSTARLSASQLPVHL